MAKSGKVVEKMERFKNLPKFLAYAGLLLLMFSLTLWWTKVYTDPKRVFWAMLDNSLSTSSVTRNVKQQNQGNLLDQYIQLNLGTQSNARVITAISQGQGDSAAKVVTESIGTEKEDYTRYTEINTKETNAEGKPLNFDQIVNVWAKADAPQSGQQSNTRYFKEALLGVVPFADLDAGQRERLLKLMQEQGVFETDFGSTGQGREQGRRTYVYRVTVKPKPYITVLQAFTREIGLGAVEGLDQTNYEGAAPLELELAVDVLSRQLVRIVYGGNGRVESYSGHGLKTNIAIPTQTIPVSELQNRLQTLR